MERKRTGDLLIKAADRHPYSYVAVCYFVIVMLTLCVSDLLVVPNAMRILSAYWAPGSYYANFEILVAWCLYALVACVLSVLVFWITMKTWIVVVQLKHIAVALVPAVIAAVWLFKRYLAVHVGDTYVLYSGLRAAVALVIGAALGGVMVCRLDSE